MFHRFSLLVIFLSCLLTHFEYIVMIQEVKRDETNPTKTDKLFGEVSEDWMKEVLNVNKDLLNVQAIIAKDEESTTNCMTGSRKTNKRHLMCVGSIVNVQHVLTSATCIQEATYIRHNLRAPLVVVVGILKSKPQVIRVNNYKVHPNHVVFPYNSQHSKHNIAVIKLSCRIATEHFTPIELPQSPYTELCTNDNCMVAIIRKVGKTSHAIYDTWAKHIPVSRRKRRSTETTTELQNNNTFRTPPANIQEKLRETLVNPPRPRSLKSKEAQAILSNNITHKVMGLSKIEKSMAVKNAKEKRNFGHQEEIVDIASEDLPFDKLGFIISRKRNSDDVPFEAMGNLLSGKQTNSTFQSINLITERTNELLFPNVSSTTNNIVDEYVFQGNSDGSNKVRLFSVRASDGFQGCPQSGSPVMFGTVQAALVSVSCDDRQPGTAWNYTDIFPNIDWIKRETEYWTKNANNHLNGSSTGCSTCIYNFFIDLTGPNDRVNCNDLDSLNEKSSNYKFCLSHYGQKGKNSLRSALIDKPNYLSNNKKLSISRENMLKVGKSNFPLDFEKRVNLQNRHFDNSKRDNSETLTFRNNSHDFSKDAVKVEKKNFTRILKTDLDHGSNRNFQKMQAVPQRNIHRTRNFYKDYNEGNRKPFQSDYYLKNVVMKNENRLKKQVESDKISRNKFDFSKIKTMNSQQSIDYNPLANKFHNLRMLLARLQKSTPGKESQKLLLGKPIEILPHGRFFNTGPGIKYVKKENIFAG